MEPDLEAVAAYYAAALARHGASARGVDWNSEASQRLRFAQFVRLWHDQPPGSLNDWGCGWGALLPYLREAGLDATYTGLDMVADMLRSARELHRGDRAAAFVARPEELPVADVTVASGVFHVKLGADTQTWWEYVAASLDAMREKSRASFAFNLLTLHSDPPRRADYLFYADPCTVWEHCRKRYSRHVALLHDYPLYEFTIGVRL